ncbi:MAG: hypothetical protein L0H94_01985 [Nitrospira sp.]|nr:hypothetical protein [Nitrospira sp.]
MNDIEHPSTAAPMPTTTAPGFQKVSEILPIVLAGIVQAAAAQQADPSSFEDRGYRMVA